MKTIPVLAFCAMVIPLPLVAGDSSSDLREQCLKATNMGEKFCTCLAEKAKAELSVDGLSLYIATMAKDKAKISELRGRMPMPDMVKAGTSMASLPAKCSQSQ